MTSRRQPALCGGRMICAAKRRYLPEGWWIDYQSGIAFEGGRGYRFAPGRLPIVALVRNGTVIPFAKVTQSTEGIDWNALEFIPFVSEPGLAKGSVCVPVG